MTRYARSTGSKPRSDWNDDYPLLPDLRVHEMEAVDTGLFDAAGERIFRIPNPIGFGRDKEW